MMNTYEEMVKVATDALFEGDLDLAQLVTLSLLGSDDQDFLEAGMNLTEIVGGMEEFE